MILSWRYELRRASTYGVLEVSFPSFHTATPRCLLYGIYPYSFLSSPPSCLSSSASYINPTSLCLYYLSRRIRSIPMSRLRIFLPVDICFCHIRLYYPPPYPSPTYLPFPLLHLILILFLSVLLSYHGPRQKIHDAAVPRDHVRCTTYLIKPIYGACCVTLLPMHLFFPFPPYGLSPSSHRLLGVVERLPPPISHLPSPISHVPSFVRPSSAPQASGLSLRWFVGCGSVACTNCVFLRLLPDTTL